MNVVATLGTALNERHIRQLRRFVPRVVLVFDADAAGERAVDRALELFVSQDTDLAVATLPAGLDPCDFLVQHEAEAFRTILSNAVDALEFKLSRVLTPERTATIEGRRLAVDSVLEVLALAPEMQGRAGEMKRQLVINRIGQRIGIEEKTLWQRLQELRQEKGSKRQATGAKEEKEQPRQAPADTVERELLEVLLAEPSLIEKAKNHVRPEELKHLGLQRLLGELYALHDAGETPTVDELRARLIDNPRLGDHVLRLQAAGMVNQQRPAWLADVLRAFAHRRLAPQVTELQRLVKTVPSDAPVPVELLRQLQERRLAESGR